MARRPRRHDFFFSPRDYLNDPCVLRMTLLERGAYSTLLFALWDQPEPGVAMADQCLLAGLARAAPDEWDMVEDAVSRCFDLDTRPGYWVQKRMVAEHKRQDAYYALKSRLGKSGAAKRWDGRAMAEPSLPQWQSDSASPASPALPAKEETKTSSPSARSGRKAKVDPGPLPDWLPFEVWQSWDEYRRSKPRGAPWTQKAALLSITALDTLREQGFSPKEVVERSILRGWTGLFPPDQPRNGTLSGNPPDSDPLARARRLLEEP